jgi:hypothetical protein
LIEYLKKRGFDEEIQKVWGLEPKDDEVLINYYDTEGNKLYTRRNRPGKNPKYISPPSEKMPEGHSVLYGLHMIKHITDTLLLIEGEYNLISAWYMGFYGLGVAGQTISLKDHHLKYIPETVKKIIILYDEPKFAELRAKEILEYFNYEKEVYIAKYPDKKDANDYFKEGLILDFQAIINTKDRYLGDQLKSPNIRVKIPSNDFVEAYKEYAKQITDAPPKYHELMALAIISTVLGRQAYLKYGVYNLYPNLYIVLIGKSTVMRKTACLNMAKNLIEKFNPDLILSNDFTPEGLFSLLSEKSKGLIIWSEFGAFLINATKNYQAGVKEFLTEVFDCPNRKNKRLSGKEYEIKDIYLNIITATTLNWFIDRINEADTMGGFLGRFIYMPCKLEDKNGWYYMPKPEPIDLSNKLVSDIKKISQLKGEFTISDEANLLLIKWLRRHEEEIEILDDSKGIIGFYARLSDYLLKFAMLYEISGSKSLTISEGSLLRAIKLVNQLKQSLNELMSEHIAFTKEAKDIQKILNLIKSEAEGIRRDKLLKNSHMTAKQLEEVLNTLMQSNQIIEFNITESTKTFRAYRTI